MGSESRIGGYSLIVGGVAYALFHAAALLELGLGRNLWVLGLALHGVTVLTIGVGLFLAGRELRLMGWESTVWNVATVVALLGVTVSHFLWSLALLGLAVVVMGRLSSPVAAGLLSAGATAWLYLYVVGVRIGDDNGPAITDGQVIIGLLALALMAAGLVVVGLRLFRQAQLVFARR